ncbi:MAG TPA: hypothetical protein VE913_21480, partial [Longimicrobium sp.]|nr:hypothetical protein [Longimicrobium sp.]
LRAAGLPGDGGSSGAAAPRSLWAVGQSLLAIQVGAGAGAGPFYLSPTPLDNTLNTATVPLPAIPAALAPATLPAQQLFTDVDLDRLNTVFFAAVDSFLAPASAARAFEVATDAYTTVATGRRSLADQYAANEVEWLFSGDAPFTGSADGLAGARATFAEQMRAALGTAYSVDTVVQYGVTWSAALPAGLGDLYSLYGEVRPTGGAQLDRDFTVSTSQVPVMQAGSSLLTFLFGVADIQTTASVSLDLEFNVTHVQHFTEPASAVAEGEARPSIWLQLVNPYPNGAPHVGPAGAVEIPLVLRQYPTPPTLITQAGVPGAGGGSAPNANPLTAAAAWHLQYRYQAQLTSHDRLANAVTYNTDMTASGGGANVARLLGDADARYTLFQSLARFSATYPLLAPILTDLASPNWASAAALFAQLVDDVVVNTTWNPTVGLVAARALPNIIDNYVVTDVAANGARTITLGWSGANPSSFSGATLAIAAMEGAGAPYPNQSMTIGTTEITDSYTPSPPLTDEWVTHQVEIDGLNVLAAENALVGVQVQRNVISMTSGGSPWLARADFVYKTPMVRATQPVTPFVDNDTPIDVATLPATGGASGCPTTNTPPGAAGLCQRIQTLMYDLLMDDAGEQLLNARALAGFGDAGAPRRVKVACSYQFPLASAGGLTSANPVSPLVPVVLARSFVIDGTDAAQLADFAARFATAAAAWAEGNQIVLGPNARSGAQFVFDITLYAQISGLNTPVLRLRNLWLSLADIAV